MLLLPLNLQANKWAWVQVKDAAGNRRTYSLALSQPPLVAPVGQSITSSVGSLTIQTADSTSLTGIAITSGQGTLSVSAGGAVNVSLTGQAITSSRGTLAVVFPNKTAWLHLKDAAGNRRTYSLGLYQDPSVTLGTQAIVTSVQVLSVITNRGVNVNLTGQAIALQQGSLTAPFYNKKAWLQLKDAAGNRSFYSVTLYQDPAVSLVGQLVTIGLGSLVAQITDGSNLTGIAVTSSAGTLAVQVVESLSLTGVAIASGQGTLTATPIQNRTSNLIGQQTLVQQGSVVTNTADGVSLTGISITSSVGTVTAQQGTFVSTTLTGIAITSGRGTITASAVNDVSPNLTGQLITSSVGNSLISVDDIGTLVGLGITGNPGTLSVQIVSVINVPLTGQAIASSSGSLSIINSKNISGQVTTTGQGSPTITSNYVGYPVTTSTALTTTDSGYQSLGFTPSDGDRSYWPLIVNATSLVPETNSGNATGRIASGPVSGNFTLIYYRLSGGIYYTIDVTLVNGQASNIILAGQNIVSSAGPLYTINSLPISGQSVTSSAGSLTVTVSNVPVLAGQQINVSQGAITLQLGRSLSLLGQSITSSAGTPNVQTGNSLVGQSITLGQGTLSVNTVVNVSIIGQQISTQAGSLVNNFGSNVSITGQLVTSGTNGLTVTNTKDALPPLTGQVITLGQGALVESVNVDVVFPGQYVQSLVGTLVTANRQVSLVGQQINSGTNSTIFALLYDIPNWITPHFVEAVLANTNR